MIILFILYGYDMIGRDGLGGVRLPLSFPPKI